MFSLSHSSSWLFTYTNRSSSFCSALRSFRVYSASTPWSYGANWRFPACLSAQIRIVALMIEKFESIYVKIGSDLRYKVNQEYNYNDILETLPKPNGGYPLPASKDPRIERLPHSLKRLLQLVIQNCDNFTVRKDIIERILDWDNTSPQQVKIPSKPAHVLLKDFTGVPIECLCDLTPMKEAMKNLVNDPNKMNPIPLLSL